ncbi:MAG: DUF6067 family protein [Planctomycetota bacterium]|nr:DUF6067 family protein [Planctomycetota bacterium]
MERRFEKPRWRFVRLALLLLLAAPAQAEPLVLSYLNSTRDEATKVTYDPRAKSEMDDLASAEAVAKFAGSLATDWTLFVEDRAHSIRKTTGLPKRWLDNLAGHTQTFQGPAQPGEFYVFQLGLFAAKAGTGPIAVRYEQLAGIRCINLGGTDFLGQTLVKTVSVEQGKLQALWFGLDVPKTTTGAIQGQIIVTAANVSQTVNVNLTVAGAALHDHGDSDSWRLSRLRWLDSTIGLDDNVVTQPFVPIAREENRLGILGRELVLGNDGLPCQIRSFFNADNTAIVQQPTRELLAAPWRFVVETDAGPLQFGPTKIRFTREKKGAVDWLATAQTQDITWEVTGLLEYDGFADCRCRITSAAPAKVKDIRLEVDVAPGADTYFMGLGQQGGKRPDSVDWKWNANVNQDGFWIGAVNGGFKLQLYGENWRTPLVNCYYHFRELMLPDSWGTGGIRLTKSDRGGTLAVAYSGPRELAAGQALDFNFRLFLTPFKPLETDAQWALRYQHGSNDEDYRDLARVKALGANIANIHQSREANPTINYPYYHRLWHGEGFNATHTAADTMLVEMSGIPFGLLGEMLDAPNPWRGMVFGMTTRLGWSGNPRPIWKFWNEFGLQGTELLGWWNPACPVKTDQPNVLATVYRKPGKSLIALASWALGKTRVKLVVDWPALGLDPRKTTLWAPAVEAFQPEAVFAVDSPLPVPPGQGWLLVADETPRQPTGVPAAPDPLAALRVIAQETPPFDIQVPANTVCTEDLPWPAGAAVVAAHLNPLRDEGQSWGVGLAVGWSNGKYVQINARTDGRWSILHNGHEGLGGSLPKGTSATVAVNLGDKTVQLLARLDGESEWDVISEVPRCDFPGVPATVRIGKIGLTWNARDHGSQGPTDPCRVDGVKFYQASK